MLARVWDRELKIMRYVEVLRLSKNGFPLGIKLWENKGERPFEFVDTFNSSSLDRFVVIWGFKYDGQEIFEEDIVKIGNDEKLYRVIFKDGCFWLFNKGQKTLIPIHCINPTSIEIVGNIYESPELIKSKKSELCIEQDTL